MGPPGWRTHREGVVVSVSQSVGPPWVGNFQCGDGSLSGIYPMPSGHHLAVIARGQGYILDIDRRVLDGLIAVDPVVEVQLSRELNLLLCISHTDMVAYSPAGIVWETGRIASDGIRLIASAPEGIMGEAWWTEEEAWVPFVVDPATGRTRRP